MRNLNILLCLVFFNFILNSNAQTMPPVDLSSLTVGPIRPLPGPFFSFLQKKSNIGLFDNAERPIVYELIAQAKKSIDIEIYEMKDAKIRSLLLKALERKVRIRIIKDPNTVGDMCNELDPTPINLTTVKPNAIEKSQACNEEKLFVASYRQAGGEYNFYNKENLCAINKQYCFMHGKMLIKDKERVLLSTGNWNPSSLCSSDNMSSTCNRDYSFVTKNKKVVQTLSKIFEHDLRGEKYDLRTVLQEGSKAISVSPYVIDPILQLIKSAKKSIWINNQYLKESVVNEALIEAAKVRGVAVNIILSDVCNYGSVSESDKKVLPPLFEKMEASGIKLKFFTKKILINGHPGYMHAKAIVSDSKIGWVGSVNGSVSSIYKNREFGIFFKHKKSIRKLLNQLRQDFQARGAINWQDSMDCKGVSSVVDDEEF
jgi:phosphatidylserine/phosphatidylglycerophosphate/cardiolipin synthase-like enzyme